MQFLINASNLKNGGALQVAQSICSQLGRFEEHRFVVVLSSHVKVDGIEALPNVTIRHYDFKDTVGSLLFGRDKVLDGIVKDCRVDAVLTIFGPSRWKPRVPHLCGFARAQLLLKDSPYYQTLGWNTKLLYALWAVVFKRSSKVFYTENAYISDMLPRLLGRVEVYTVTNYYNQVFDQPENWTRKVKLPTFEGVTMLTVSSTAAHKNLGIMVPVAEWLERQHPDFHFRFVLTCKQAPFALPEKLKKHFVFIGKVDVAECPNLYEQADIMFMPTLMECFTATYPEAMRMEVPIVTTDLEFARGLCGNAACYYSAVNAEAAAEAIYKVATDSAYRLRLTTYGKQQLKKFDNYEQRANKLVGILEAMVSKR